MVAQNSVIFKATGRKTMIYQYVGRLPVDTVIFLQRHLPGQLNSIIWIMTSHDSSRDYNDWLGQMKIQSIIWLPVGAQVRTKYRTPQEVF
jgi:hypothetical protein